MTKEISLSFLLNVLRTAWWKILIITVTVAVAVAAFTQFLIPKKYESSIEFYIINTSTTSEYTQTSLLAANEYLANDYITIINSDRMIEKIAQALYDEGYGEFTYKQIRRMISSSTSSESSTFGITVTTTDKDIAYCIANTIQNEAPAIIKNVTRPSYSSNYYKKTTAPDGTVQYEKIDESDLECVKVVREARLATSHVSPSLITYTFIGAVLAACAAYCVFLLIKLSDTVIRSESGARELINPAITVIGTIPYWSTSTNEKSI